MTVCGLDRPEDERGLSTTVDAVLCLLLVSAAVLTLAGAPVDSAGRSDTDPDRPGDAAPVDLDAAVADAADVVGTSTATVSFSLAPGARHADETLVDFDVTAGPAFERTTHGTLAGLVSTATLRAVTVDGERLTRTADGYRRAVAGRVAGATARRDLGVRVRASWEPYDGAPVGGRFVAGGTPPPDADVAAATLTVASGLPRTRDAALRAARRGGVEGLATHLSRTTVAGLFPPNRTRLALRGDAPTARLVAYRYRRAAHLLNTSVAAPVAEADTRTANDRLVRALAERYASDLRRDDRRPVAVARTVRSSTVTVVVRTWSR